MQNYLAASCEFDRITTTHLTNGSVVMSLEAIRTAICSQSDSDRSVQLWDLNEVAGSAPPDRASSGVRRNRNSCALFQQRVLTNLVVWGVADRIVFNFTTAASG